MEERVVHYVHWWHGRELLRQPFKPGAVPRGLGGPHIPEDYMIRAAHGWSWVRDTEVL